MQAYQESPPPGYARVDVDQLKAADVELFKLIIKETRSGVRPSGSVMPVELALIKKARRS